MSQTLDFTLDRALKTRDAQENIQAVWTWSEKTPEQWDGSISALRTQNETLSQTEINMLAKRAETDAALDKLNAWTSEGLTLLRLRLRNEPEKLASLSTLSANGTSRANKLKEALEWEKAWATIDATFAPTKENTFAAFQTLRKRCVKLGEEYGKAETDVTTENTRLITLKVELEDENQAWYKAATKVFKKGTPEGEMIRSSVPTTTGGPSPVPEPPAQPAPTPAPVTP